ncbi:hypothetical protein H5410_026218 [Solanum commersonii]|uniref:Uncharacterized protein n=1 Tax=Solanum commersonii TaxID=4109 RepID=A0A9J5Z0V2_SOLCO|nr:hypothetical protein H5410_026218 [Solanum commersonii]
MAKPNIGLFSEEIDAGSMRVSSVMSERLFEGDLPKGKGPESCILTAGVELVAVQILVSLRGDVQPTFLEHELESPDQVPHRNEPIFDQTPKSFNVGSDKEEEEIPLKWKSRGRRGGKNLKKMLLRKERHRKGKGKLVPFHPKGDKRKYVTRSETQKANKAQIERTRKRRREGLEPEQPSSIPLPIESSETEFEDVAKYVAKRRREAEVEMVKSQVNQKGGNKSPAKRVKRGAGRENGAIKGLEWKSFDPNILTKFGMVNLVDHVTIQGWNHRFETPVQYLHEPKVREFFYKIELLDGGEIKTIVRNVEICLDEEILGIILGMPVIGTRTIEGCKPTGDFSKCATKRGDVKLAGIPNKFLKGSIS